MYSYDQHCFQLPKDILFFPLHVLAPIAFYVKSTDNQKRDKKCIRFRNIDVVKCTLITKNFGSTFKCSIKKGSRLRLPSPFCSIHSYIHVYEAVVNTDSLKACFPRRCGQISGTYPWHPDIRCHTPQVIAVWAAAYPGIVLPVAVSTGDIHRPAQGAS